MIREEWGKYYLAVRSTSKNVQLDLANAFHLLLDDWQASDAEKDARIAELEGIQKRYYHLLDLIPTDEEDLFPEGWDEI